MSCSGMKSTTMKNKKLIQALFTPGSGGRTPALIALAAGLAVGAAIGILFAPESGKQVRDKIRDTVKGLGKNIQEEPEVVESPRVARAAPKKPKSDIKALVHDAHASGAHTEQGIG